MASSNINLFNFYERYLWNKDDFSDLQSALINSLRGSYEGFTGGAILSGLVVKQVSGNQIRVTSGIAVSPDGTFMYFANDYDFTLSSPSSNAERSLIVIRPKTVSNTLIDKPTDPGVTVYLKVQQSCEVAVIRGTSSATPSYPSKLTNDVILSGVRVRNTGTIDGNYDFDYSIREILGRNRTSQRVDQSIYDDRLRPYRSGSASISIKPSVSGFMGSGGDSANPTVFTNIDQNIISKFPRDGGGSFNFADTVVNLATGTITGGDAQSPDFSPPSPSASNKYRVGLIQISTSDILNVKFYGSDSSSKSAAFGLIFNRSIYPDAGYKLICYFVVYSAGGSTWQDVDLIDARHPGNVVHNGDFGDKNLVTTGSATIGSSASGTIQIGSDTEAYGRIHFDSDSYTTLYHDNHYDSANAVMKFRLRTGGITPVTSMTLAGTGAVTLGPDTGAGSGTTTDALEHIFNGSINVKPNTGTAPTDGGDVDCDFIVPYVAGGIYLISQAVYSNSNAANCQTKIYLAIEKTSGQFTVSTMGTTTGGTGVTIQADPLFSRSGDVLTITISTDHTGVTGSIRQGIIRFG
jgi:hypothetical protein